MNNGAYSATYSEQGLDGIATLQPAGNIVRTEIFSANGTQVSSMSRGINIIRRTFANGAVKTYKVIIK